jgi:hypothetical protein
VTEFESKRFQHQPKAEVSQGKSQVETKSSSSSIQNSILVICKTVRTLYYYRVEFISKSCDAAAFADVLDKMLLLSWVNLHIFLPNATSVFSICHCLLNKPSANAMALHIVKTSCERKRVYNEVYTNWLACFWIYVFGSRRQKWMLDAILI